MRKITGNKNFGLMVGLIALLILAAVITPDLYSVGSLMNMLRNNWVFVFLAVGEMIVIISGGIDISISCIMALSGCVCSLLQFNHPQVPVFLWLIVAVLVGTVCGMFNGFVVGTLKVTPMIATLGTNYIFRGLAFIISSGAWWYPHQYQMTFQNFSIGKTAGIYNIIWFAALILILAAVFLNYTTPGRRIYAVGTNKESAKVSGIRESRVMLMSYTICGAVCGLSGMLYVANFAVGNFAIGDGFEMTAIAICILGGVSIIGGQGKVGGVFIAILMMSIITSFISMLPGLSVWQDAIKGAIIIIAVGINIWTARSTRRRELKERGALL